MRVERVEPDRAGPVDRRVQPDRADDVRGSRLEPRRRGEEGGALERDLVDHRAAALVRRHRVEQLGPRPQRADPGRAVELVAGEDVEIAIDRGDIDRQARRRLAAVEQQFRADLVRDRGGARRIEDRAEHVRDMGEGDHGMLFVGQLLGRVEVDPAVLGQRDDVDVVTGELPRDDVRMMLERRQQYAPAAVVGEARRDQVDRLGRAAREHHFMLLPADQIGGRGARRFEARGHRRRAFVDPAVDGRIIAAIGVGDRVDHRLRLLRGGGAVEIMPAGDRRELVAHRERAN